MKTGIIIQVYYKYMDFEGNKKLKSAAELAAEKTGSEKESKQEKNMENVQEETNIKSEKENNQEKEEAEKSARELEEMKLKDEKESSQKADEIRKKINGGEMEKKALEMMSSEERNLSFERQQLLDELESWAKEDPVELAKSVKTFYVVDYPENSFQGEYKYLNPKGEQIMKKIDKKEDIRNAVDYSIDMKNGREIRTGSAELKINKGLEGMLAGKKWIENTYTRVNGGRYDSIEHSSKSAGRDIAVGYYQIAEKLKKVLMHDKTKGVFMGNVPADLHK